MRQCLFHRCSKDDDASKKSAPDTLRPPSQLLLKPEPKRGGKKPKTHIKTNVSIIIEFGLQVLMVMAQLGLNLPFFFSFNS